jgi:tetratricopeptide (TPR) repeat protein
MVGDVEAALPAGEESLALYRQLDDPRGCGRALNLLGAIKTFNEPALARPLLEQSAASARTAGDTWCLAASQGRLGFAECFLGDFSAARPVFGECIAVSRANGDSEGLAVGLIGLGYAALQTAAYRQARELLEEGLEVARGLKDTIWMAAALGFLGELAAARGDPDRASAFNLEGIGTSAWHGVPWERTSSVTPTGRGRGSPSRRRCPTPPGEGARDVVPRGAGRV